MKNFYLILFSFLVFFSCSNNDKAPSFDINGQFNDNIVKCNSVEIEPNCISRISFIDDSKAYIIAFGDIVLLMNYTIQGNKIELEENANYNEEITFEIINETTLKRVQDGAVFLKEE